MAPRLIPPAIREKVGRRFQLLGEPARLDILNWLHVKGEMNVQQLVESTGYTQANVSKHLRLLADNGLVSRRKEGLYAFYQISDPSLSGLCLLVCSQISSEQDLGNTESG